MAGGASAAAWLGGCRMFRCGGDYSVTVLGDMHYDTFPKERFHSAALKKWSVNGAHPMRLKEFERNAKIWSGISRRILDASAKCVRPDAAFALQLGDLVQGDCESDRLHREMLAEATGLLEKAYPDLPIISLCGNHDIREGDNDRGSVKAYADYMLPWESKQLAAFAPDGVVATTFGFRKGPDLWIVLDFNHDHRDRAIVERLLEENRDVRYTFVVTHGPVLPMDLWRCPWYYMGYRPAEERRAMRALFAKRNAIVLAGHEHTLVMKDWFGDGGRITEIILNTCAGISKGGINPAVPKVLGEDPADYGFISEKGPVKPDKLSALYDEYRPGLKRRYVANAVGHHILHVSDDRVELDYYGHDSLVPMKTFTLRG